MPTFPTAQSTRVFGDPPRSNRGDLLPLYGDGSKVRELTYVRDNCRAVELVMREGRPGCIYNIGSGEEFRNIEVTHRILDVVGASEDLIEFVEDRPGHDQRYALDTSRIEALGWKPQWSFAEGIDRTVAYYVS